MRRRLFVLIGAFLLLGTKGFAQQKRINVLVVAGGQGAFQTPVFASLPGGGKYSSGRLVLKQGNAEIPAQLFFEGKTARIGFLVPQMAPNERRVYTLETRKPFRQKSQWAEVRLVADAIEIHLQERQPNETNYAYRLFTRYLTQSRPNKPFFYPLLSPDSEPLTRRWPLEQVATDTHDHPHHRGLWFTHGEVNGIDFWSEEPRAGRTAHDRLEDYQSGEVFARFVATTQWIAPNKEIVATDTRTVLVYPLPNGDRLMDFEVVLRPKGGELLLGDTKEGSFGLRVPDAWAPDKKQGGHILNARGQKDAALWGKPAEWVDYWGKLKDKNYGIALFDHPNNLRHPQTWHTRTYGLYAVNPFGLHDFGRGEKGTGNYAIPANGSMTLRYRLLFHRNDTEAGKVKESFEGYADPPKVTVQ